MRYELYINNSNDIIVTGLATSESDETYINDATITAQLIDQNDDNTDGEVEITSITLAYEAGSNGNYRGSMNVLEADVTLGKDYVIRITSSNYQYIEDEIDAIVVKRKTR